MIDNDSPISPIFSPSLTSCELLLAGQAEEEEPLEKEEEAAISYIP